MVWSIGDSVVVKKLMLHDGLKAAGSTFSCVMCVHNEGKILEEFFRHHRSIGIDSFLVVDDRSTDETANILSNQPDVTIFHPKNDSQFRDDKKDWMTELLNRYCSNSWVLCLDADEHLVYRDMESRSVQDLTAELEQENLDSFPALMLDMYADKSLAEHSFTGGRLIDAFPYFDEPSSYRIMYKRNSRLFHASGGMRSRLFAKYGKRIIPPGFPLRINKRRSDAFIFLKRKIDQLAKAYRNSLFGPDGYRPNSLKVPLFVWKKEMNWDEHNLTSQKGQSKEMGALLHFKMAKGIDGVKYIAQRGQHAGQSQYARWILSADKLGEINPVYLGSKQYLNSDTIFRES